MPTLTRFTRALLLKCPRCGNSILKDWFHLQPECTECGLVTDRGESGYQVGSYLMAMMAIEIVFVVVIVGTVVVTWPTPPWTLLGWGGPILMLIGPVALFPFTKTVYLAFDLTFRPEV